MTAETICEGFNVAGRWVDCDRPMPHFHGILADMLGDCEWSSASECAMARERSVAGVSDAIPACPVHGEHEDARPLCFLIVTDLGNGKAGEFVSVTLRDGLDFLIAEDLEPFGDDFYVVATFDPWEEGR